MILRFQTTSKETLNALNIFMYLLALRESSLFEYLSIHRFQGQHFIFTPFLTGGGFDSYGMIARVIDEVNT